MEAEGTSGISAALTIIALGFLAYFVGIVIRKVALPGRDSPSLRDQLLLGVPLSLGVVSPLLAVLNAAFADANPASFLVTIGVIMEHGMFLNETLAKKVKDMVSGRGIGR